MEKRPLSFRKKEFFKVYSEFSDYEKEMLYKQTLANKKLESIRINISLCTWILIISLVASLLIYFSHNKLL